MRSAEAARMLPENIPLNFGCERQVPPTCPALQLHLTKMAVPYALVEYCKWQWHPNLLQVSPCTSFKRSTIYETKTMHFSLWMLCNASCLSSLLLSSAGCVQLVPSVASVLTWSSSSLLLSPCSIWKTKSSKDRFCRCLKSENDEWNNDEECYKLIAINTLNSQMFVCLSACFYENVQPVLSLHWNYYTFWICLRICTGHAGNYHFKNRN